MQFLCQILPSIALWDVGTLKMSGRMKLCIKPSFHHSTASASHPSLSHGVPVSKNFNELFDRWLTIPCTSLLDLFNRCNFFDRRNNETLAMTNFAMMKFAPYYFLNLMFLKI